MLGVGRWEFIGMGSHRRRLVADIRPCSSVRRSDLQTPLRRVSRAPRRWQNPRRRHAAEHAEFAHPAHARLRCDDDHRVSVESRGARCRRAFPWQSGRRSSASAGSVLQRSFCFDQHECVTSLERLESVAHQLTLFASGALEADSRAGFEAEAEVGLWIRGRHLRVLATHGHWQPGLHRQRRRRGARAARGHGLSAVDIPGCGIDSLRDGGRAAGRPDRVALRRSHWLVLRARRSDR